MSDIDYLDKLNEEEKTFLNKFMDEWVNASFPQNQENLITDEKDRKEIRHRNYARKEDAYTRSKAGNRLKNLDEVNESYNDENELNFQIEIKRRNSRFIKKLKKEL